MSPLPQISDKEAKAVISVKLRNHLPDPVKGHYAVSVYELDAEDRVGAEVAKCKSLSLNLPADGTLEDSVTVTVSEPRRWSLEQTNRYLARVVVFDGKNRSILMRYLSDSGQSALRTTMVSC